MNIYGLSIIILCILWLISKLSKKSQKNFCIISTILLICLMGFRDYLNGGVDLVRYYRHFERLESYSLWDSLTYSDNSFLYYFINCLFQKFNLSYQFLLFFVSVFEMCIIGKFFWRFSKNILLSYFVIFGTGVFTFLFSGLRQGIAMTILLICFEFYIDKKWLRLIICLLIAIGFHPTAIVIIPLFFISRIKFSKLLVLFYMICFVICVVFRLSLGEFLTSIYAEEYIGEYSSSLEIGGTAIFCIIVTTIYFFLCYDKIKKMETIEFYIAHGIVLLTIIQVYSAYAYTFTRLNLYLMLLIMTLVVPEITDRDNLKNKLGKFSQVVSVIIFIVFTIIMLSKFSIHIESEMLMNYKFFWE